MPIAIIIGAGALLLLALSKAHAATPPEESTPAALPPPEPEDQAAAATARAQEYEQAAMQERYAAGAARASAPSAPNRPFGDQPIDVDAAPDAQAQEGAAQERAEAAAQGGGGGGGGGAVQPSAAASNLNFTKPKATATPALKAAAKTITPAKPTGKRAPIQAARELLQYVSAAISAGQGATLGSKNAPNAVVKAAQLDMGVSPADGIYGPATRNRGKALTGNAFPARDAPPLPKASPARPAAPKATAAPKANVKVTPAKPSASRNATQAARELLQYVSAAIKGGQGATLGSKNTPNAVVKAAQLDMGVSPADGIYGPATRNRGKALTGSTFPAR